MDVNDGTSNGDCKQCSVRVRMKKKDAADNLLEHNATDVSSGGSDGLQTYKRRKLAKSSSDGKAPEDGKEVPVGTGRLAEQDHWRNAALQKMYNSVRDAGGVEDCIKEALSLHQGIGCVTTDEDYHAFSEDMRNYSSQMRPMPNGTQSADTVKDQASVSSNGPSNAPDHLSYNGRCQRAFTNILKSEKFSCLCRLLLENFQGMKGDSLFNLSLINSRMKEGAYEQTPGLFSGDVQQIWRNLEVIGMEMSSLAKSLSELSAACCDEHIHKPVAKQEQIEATDKVNVCRHCKVTADGRDSLACDSCEEMYHVACIVPPMKELPPKRWYCSICTGKGIGSSHENCVVCERISEVADDISLTNQRHELLDEDSEISEENADLCKCNICGGQVKDEDELRICDHAFCPNKNYHTRCLSPKQLKSYSPRWYCPSCLCRVCLADKNDDQIVLCDGCDEAYHTFCMTPPRSSIPKGEWFCEKCHFNLQKIRSARIAYEKSESEGAYRNFDKKPSDDKVVRQLSKSGGVDMLLTAAKTLNYEEKISSARITS